MSSIITVLVILALLEVYVYFGLRSVFPAGGWVTFSVQGFSILISIGAILLINSNSGIAFSPRTIWANLLLGLFITFTLTKLVYGSALLVEDVFRGVKFLVLKIINLFGAKSPDVSVDSRRKFIGYIGLGLAAIPFSGLLYGTLFGKYDYKVHKVKIKFPDLPEAFNGLRIVQVSDIHSGSFDSLESVQRGVDLIQEQAGDLILFTGDLVNNVAEEIEPYKQMFGALSAPMGKFSILGNHDYGDYKKWSSKEEKTANLDKLKQHHADMDFRLLLNEHITLEQEGQRIQIAGVENWGRPPFTPYGELDAALDGMHPDDFVVLLSHDPDHWDYKVRVHEKHVHLTLSGHTHGMQMGIEIDGFLKWSPIQYRYPRWAGLYSESAQYLYVNRGFGFLGYPGRAGIWPEITVIELERTI